MRKVTSFSFDDSSMMVISNRTKQFEVFSRMLFTLGTLKRTASKFKFIEEWIEPGIGIFKVYKFGLDRCMFV